MKKKIVFVFSKITVGGAERIVFLLQKYINQHRFSVILVTLRDGQNNFFGQKRKIESPISLNKRSQIDFLSPLMKLSQVLSSERPNLIISVLGWGSYLVFLAQFFSRRRIPVIILEQGNLSHALKGEKIAFLKRLMARKLYQKADDVIAVSRGVREDLFANFGLKKDKCQVIYNAVEVERILMLAKEKIEHPWFHEDSHTLVACGRLVPQKNFPMLLEAVRLVRSKSPVRLIIVGDGPERLKLETYARNLGIDPYVSFAGLQNNPFKYMAKATAFVLSSMWEGFANVILEAMVCGAPVVSTRCPSGPDEIIKDGINGLLVPMGDTRALAEAIIRLLGDECLRQRLKDKARETIENFRIEKIIAEYETIFTKACGCIKN